MTRADSEWKARAQAETIRLRLKPVADARGVRVRPLMWKGETLWVVQKKVPRAQKKAGKAPTTDPMTLKEVMRYLDKLPTGDSEHSYPMPQRVPKRDDPFPTPQSARDFPAGGFETNRRRH